MMCSQACLMGIFRLVDLKTLCDLVEIDQFNTLAMREFYRRFSEIWFRAPLDHNLLLRVISRFGDLITIIRFEREIHLEVDVLNEIDRNCPALERITFGGITYHGFHTLRNILRR